MESLYYNGSPKYLIFMHRMYVYVEFHACICELYLLIMIIAGKHFQIKYFCTKTKSEQTNIYSRRQLNYVKLKLKTMILLRWIKNYKTYSFSSPVEWLKTTQLLLLLYYCSIIVLLYCTIILYYYIVLLYCSIIVVLL